MTWTVRYERDAERAIDALDPSVRRGVLLAIGRLARDPVVAATVKAMKGGDEYRLRVGDWRVVYTLHDDVLWSALPTGGRCLSLTVYRFAANGGSSSPTPRRWPNSVRSLSRSASGSGGFRIEATFARRWSASPVPNSTTSTPGSCLT